MATIAEPITDPALAAVAVDILGQLATEPTGRTALLQSGRALPLLHLLSPDSLPLLTEAAAATLAALAIDPAGCAVLRGVLPPTRQSEADPPSEVEQPPAPPVALKSLPKLLAVDSASGLRRAATGLAIAACNDAENATLLVSEGVMPTLISMSAENGSGVGSAATTAVQALCRALPSVMLWHTSELPASARITDGFYAVTKDAMFLSLDQMSKQMVYRDTVEVTLCSEVVPHGEESMHKSCRFNLTLARRRLAIA